MLVESLAALSGVSEARLLLIAATASARYKVFEVPKRSGGMRTIHHPSRELKAIQRWIAKVVFSRLPVHDNASAYKAGASVKNNAMRHLYTNYTTRFDFENFFPSFRDIHVIEFLNIQNRLHGIGMDERDVVFVCDLVCRHGTLTIGAPTSPALTNAMMYEFDNYISNLAKKNDLIYSRYADDIFVSSFEGNKINLLEIEIFNIISKISYLDLVINKNKTVRLSRRYNRRITGLNITPDRNISIGRGRKREIKSLMFRWVSNQLEPERISYLRGLLAYAFDVEPAFQVTLRKKYGSDAVVKIMRDSEATGADFLDDF